MGLDRVTLRGSLANGIVILNDNCFRQLYYTYKDGEVRKSNTYLVEKEKLPSINSNILDVILNYRYNFFEISFSSKDILLDQGYPNKGLSELNYSKVIEDLNDRAQGIYKINTTEFFNAKVVSAEVFIDLDKSLLNSSVEDLIHALSYSQHRRKETRIYGNSTFLSRSRGFSLQVYDKEEECFKKSIGSKYKKLKPNVKNSIRIEVTGTNDSKSRGLKRKYFYEKRLKDLLKLETQYSLIMDFINELKVKESVCG